MKQTPQDTVECAYCGTDVKESVVDHIASHNVDVCDECFYDNTFECCLCNERFHNDDSGLVVMMTADVGDVPIGVYLVQRWPFFSQPMIGMGHTHDDAMQKVADLPPQVSGQEWSPAGQFVCIDCGARYETMREQPISKIQKGLLRLRRRALASWRAHGSRAPEVLTEIRRARHRRSADALLLLTGGPLALNTEHDRRGLTEIGSRRAWYAMYDYLKSLGAPYKGPAWRECERLASQDRSVA